MSNQFFFLYVCVSMGEGLVPNFPFELLQQFFSLISSMRLIMFCRRMTLSLNLPGRLGVTSCQSGISEITFLNFWPFQSLWCPNLWVHFDYVTTYDYTKKRSTRMPYNSLFFFGLLLIIIFFNVFVTLIFIFIIIEVFFF